MVARVRTVAFEGIEVVGIDVQVQLMGGLPAFNIVGLPNKAVSEAKERVQAALKALGLALPPKRVTVNLAPADLAKEGSHFDLPIALATLVAMDILDQDELDGFCALGELYLDGSLTRVSGVLPAAVHAAGEERGLVCPAACGGEAAWAGGPGVVAAETLLGVINHFKGTQRLAEPAAEAAPDAAATLPDMADIKGQETAKRCLEIAAAGGHNLLMMGPPGAGKSMLAARLPGLLPPLSPGEALELSMIHSVAGMISDGRISFNRPFRDPHHSASPAALVGGSQHAKPGEVSLAHLGVLFLDELPEFNRQALEALRQPLETGRAVIARARGHVTYPARVQLVAAMNPCRCGYFGDSELACRKAPRCAQDYQERVSGPVFDRIDLHCEVPAMPPTALGAPATAESSATIAQRVAAARTVQRQRFAAAGAEGAAACNAALDGELLNDSAAPDSAGRSLLQDAAQKLRLSARGYHRILRVARTIADLDGTETISRPHIAEALTYRRTSPGAQAVGS